MKVKLWKSHVHILSFDSYDESLMEFSTLVWQLKSSLKFSQNLHPYQMLTDGGGKPFTLDFALVVVENFVWKYAFMSSSLTCWTFFACKIPARVQLSFFHLSILEANGLSISTSCCMLQALDSWTEGKTRVNGIKGIFSNFSSCNFLM